ncbi:MAG: dimethylarginine dimethylaminohydrolase family protein [Gammaproteobacteria bacterium]
MLVAVTRGISPRFADCELTHIAREPIDTARAHAEHAAYEALLRELGAELHRLPADPGLPDCVFVEDTAVVLPECAVITRPGAASRRPETTAVAEILSGWRTLHRIEPPGTLDGGDVLVLDRRVLVGLGGRSNASGISQLRDCLAPRGYAVEAVPLRDCLHLKSAVTRAGPESLILNPAWVDAGLFRGWQLVEVDPAEPGAANVLLVGDELVTAAHHARSRERLERAGLRPRVLEASEVARAEGALTCCSLIFEGGAQGVQ